MRLLHATPPEWLAAVLADFDEFLLDHAACERKASGTAMAFVSHYPDRPEIVQACAELAVEELGHFRDVVALLLSRGLALKPDGRDPYVRRLAREFRSGTDAYLLDRLLVASIIEARGCERLALVASGHPEEKIRNFYRELARSEARHQDLYADLARRLFGDRESESRLAELLEAEARILRELPVRAALFHVGAGALEAASGAAGR
ncbi:MAG TPA: tRNA-(ms[2]io[6]A)-hydroxylase [Thermoanaerobaculia bacterium]|nr:tRNA-(ms[2]io[6]A)-hydroxylase [Thermoanaerobaculia bacterium]